MLTLSNLFNVNENVSVSSRLTFMLGCIDFKSYSINLFRDSYK